MRYALIADTDQAHEFALKVEAVCQANPDQAAEAFNVPKGAIIDIKPCWIAWLEKWGVLMPVEPDIEGMEVVDGVEPVSAEEDGSQKPEQVIAVAECEIVAEGGPDARTSPEV